MSTFTWTPDFGAEQESAPRSVSFASGSLEDRRADGINADLKKWRLYFSGRGDTETAAILAFLHAQAGATAFTWTPPGGAASLWLCRSWSSTVSGYDANSVQATFEQVVL